MTPETFARPRLFIPRKGPGGLPLALIVGILAGLWWISVAVTAKPRSLPLVVEESDGKLVDGVLLRLVGEPHAKVRGGSVTLQLNPDVQPGEEVQLQLEDRRFGFLSPASGRFRVPVEPHQVTRILLFRRGDNSQLQPDEARRSLSKQAVEALDDNKNRQGQLSDEARILVLSELGRKYDLDPQEIDRALEAWGSSPLAERDRDLLERYLEYFPRAVESAGGTVEFTGPVRFGDRSVVVVNPAGEVIINRGGGRLFLRADLEDLALGESSTVEVGAAPATALDGAKCAWEISPADFLTVVGNGQRDCSLPVAMPELPVARYGPRVDLRLTARISRGGALLDEIKETVTVNNGIVLRAEVIGAPLVPNGQVLINITSLGKDAPLPAEYQCSWSAVSPPLRRTPTATNECTSRIELMPDEEWTSAEFVSWLSSLRRGPTWVVTATYRGQPIPGGVMRAYVQVQDHRSRVFLERELNARLRQETQERVEEKERDNLVLQMRKLGLPPLAEVTASNLKLRADISSRGWRLQALYVGDGAQKGREAALLISGKRSPLQVLYSADGTNFTSQGGMGTSRDLQALVGLDHYWLKLEVSSQASVRSGPFRLELDGSAEFRAAARRYWDAMDDNDRRDLACTKFTGHGVSNLTEARILLPILESVSVRRAGGSVWRTAVYGADLALLSESTFELVPKPLAEAPSVVRLEWSDGSREEFECPASYGEGGPRTGLHYTLKKVEPRGPRAAEEGPSAIEVFVERDWDGKWRVQYERRFQPTYVRYSTDGEVFATVKPSGRFGTFVRIGEPRGTVLHLSLVNRDGAELAYRGPLDFDQHHRSLLLKTLDVTLQPSCRESSGRIGSNGVARGKEVRCEILDKRGSGRNGGRIQVGRIAHILDHIQFGCSEDQMNLREDFGAVKAQGRDLDEVDLTFLLEEPCATVFARMILNDGSKSELLVIPVLTGF